MMVVSTMELQETEEALWKIELSEKQEQAWAYLVDGETTIVGYGGSVNSGKSWLIASFLFTYCFNYPGIRAFVGREELKLLRSTFKATWDKMIRYQGYKPDDIYKWNGQDNYMQFENGSRLDLLDLKYEPSDPEYQRLGSYEFTLGAVEEIPNVDEEVLQVLITRIGRCMNAEYSITPKILATMNPTRNWSKRFFYDRWKNDELPADVKFVPALPDDNKFADPEYFKMLGRNLNESQKKRLLEGDWEYSETDANALTTKHQVERIFNEPQPESDLLQRYGYQEKKPQPKKYLTCDVARFGGDRSVILYWEDLVVRDITVTVRKSTSETADLVAEKAKMFNVPYGNIIVDEIGVGGGTLDALNEKLDTRFGRPVGFIANATPFKKKKKDVIEFGNLRSQLYYELAEKINRREVFIPCADKQLQDTITNELEAQLKSKNILSDGRLYIIEKKKVKEATGASPDLADAIMMRMYYELNKSTFWVV